MRDFDKQLKPANHFLKTLHVTCLTGFSIRVWLQFHPEALIQLGTANFQDTDRGIIVKSCAFNKMVYLSFNKAYFIKFWKEDLKQTPINFVVN